MGYNLEGGDAIKLQKIVNLDDIAPGTAIVVNDIYHSEDLSGGSDIDQSLNRAPVLKWNPGEGHFLSTHVYISTDGESYAFLRRLNTLQPGMDINPLLNCFLKMVQISTGKQMMVELPYPLRKNLSRKKF